MVSHAEDRAGPSRGAHDDDRFHTMRPGPPSIISSRMTDIDSDDGPDGHPRLGTDPARRSGGLFPDIPSRPDTARAGLSSRSPALMLGAFYRRDLPSQGNGQSGQGSSFSLGHPAIGSLIERPTSAASRSHVPSLVPNAFYRPMSSQRLQAQRGLSSRPSTMLRLPISEGPLAQKEDEDRRNHGRSQGPEYRRNNSVSSGGIITTTITHMPRRAACDRESLPSRPSQGGPEGTEHGTLDRYTAEKENASPAGGKRPVASVTDSARLLQQKPPNRLSKMDITDGQRSTPTRSRTPRSYRSSFLLPSRNASASNRDTQGAEKLESLASTINTPSATGQKKDKSEKDDLSLGRNFEYFEGNTKFCMGGRLQNARDRPINLATFFALIIPIVLFFVFSAPWIWKHISPAIPATFAYFCFVALSSFWHASVTDPGILPRGLHRFPPPEPDEDPLRLAPPTNDWVRIRSKNKKASMLDVPTKYCKTCNIWRGPRSHHCRICDNCVDTQDHHCVWLNNCVGRRNYRYFFTFVSSTAILCIYLIAASLTQITVYSNQKNISLSAAISHLRVPFAMVFYGAVGLLYPAALVGYHLFLMARAETTREYLNAQKFVRHERYRPFARRTIWSNMFVVLCRPRPPTYYRFKARYMKGDQRLGSRKRSCERRRARSKEEVELGEVKPQQGGFRRSMGLQQVQAP